MNFFVASCLVLQNAVPDMWHPLFAEASDQLKGLLCRVSDLQSLLHSLLSEVREILAKFLVSLLHWNRESNLYGY